MVVEFKKTEEAQQPLPKPRGRPQTGFNKKDYQRAYMADQKRAKACGMTVKEWRKKRQELKEVAGQRKGK